MIETNDQVLADHENGMWCASDCKVCLINSLKSYEWISQTTKIFLLKSWHWENEKDLPYSTQPWAGFLTLFIFNEKVVSCFFLFMSAYEWDRMTAFCLRSCSQVRIFSFFIFSCSMITFCWYFPFSLFTFLVSPL